MKKIIIIIVAALSVAAAAVLTAGIIKAEKVSALTNCVEEGGSALVFCLGGDGICVFESAPGVQHVCLGQVKVVKPGNPTE